MFDNKKIQKFFKSDWKTGVLRSRNVFVYSENLDKIISLANHSYNYEPDQSVNGVTITAGEFPYLPRGPPGVFWRSINNQLNFTIKIKLFTDYMDYMKWLATDDIEIGLITSDYKTGLSLLPLLQYGSHIKLKSLSYQQSSTYFLDVFSINLWLGFLAMTFAFILIAVSIVKFTKSIKKDYGEQVIQIISPMFGQGIHESSTKNSYRTLLLLIFIMSIFFGIAFSTFLTAKLSIRHYEYPFKGLDGLLFSKTYSLCAPDSAVYIHNLDSAPTNLNEGNCPKMDRNEFDENLLCKLKNIAVLTTTYKAKKNDKICELDTLPELYMKNYISPLISAKFKYKETMNVWFLRMESNGIRNHIQRHIKPHRFLNPNAIDDFQQVKFEAVVWILTGYFIFIVLAIVILIIEILTKNI